MQEERQREVDEQSMAKSKKGKKQGGPLASKTPRPTSSTSNLDSSAGMQTLRPGARGGVGAALGLPGSKRPASPFAAGAGGPATTSLGDLPDMGAGPFADFRDEVQKVPLIIYVATHLFTSLYPHVFFICAGRGAPG